MNSPLEGLLGRRGGDIRERLGGFRERVEVLEPQTPRPLVASVDITRRDQLGRKVVACPRGTAPAHWLRLSAAESASLVPPAPAKPAGHLTPGGYGFTPEGTRLGGFTIENTGGNRW